jgi:hypothetical protein
MSEVTPIRPDVSVSDAPKRKRRSPRTSVPKISADSAKYRCDGGELDGIANVLHFLHNTQSLDSCDYQDDEAFKGGRAEILEWLERRVRAVGAGAA